MIKRIKWLLYSLISTLLFFGFLELLSIFIVRSIHRVSVDNEMVRSHLLSSGFKYDPDLFWVWRRLPDPHTPLTSDGFRRWGEVEIKKGKGVIRCFTLGDSATFGAGVRLEDTYSHKLESLLNSNAKEGIVFEVMNTGISGYRTLQMLRLIKKKLLKFDPDLLIVYAMEGDSPRDDILKPPPLSRLKWLHPVRSVLFNSKFYYLLRKGFESLKEKIKTIGSKKPYGEGVDWEDNIDLIVSLAKFYGIEVLLVEYPFLVMKVPRIDCLSNSFRERFSDISGVMIADTCDALWNSGYSPFELMIDGNHQTPLGHTIIAEEIFRTIKEEKPEWFITSD